MFEKEKIWVGTYSPKSHKHPSSPWHSHLSHHRAANVIAIFLFKRTIGKNWSWKPASAGKPAKTDHENLLPQEKEGSTLAFLSQTSSQEIRSSRSLLLSSRLTENLTWGTSTPTHPKPMSSRRQDGQMVVWRLFCRLSTTPVWVLSPYHLSHHQSHSSSYLLCHSSSISQFSFTLEAT